MDKHTKSDSLRLIYAAKPAAVAERRQPTLPANPTYEIRWANAIDLEPACRLAVISDEAVRQRASRPSNDKGLFLFHPFTSPVQLFREGSVSCEAQSPCFMRALASLRSRIGDKMREPCQCRYEFNQQTGAKKEEKENKKRERKKQTRSCLCSVGD